MNGKQVEQKPVLTLSSEIIENQFPPTARMVLEAAGKLLASGGMVPVGGEKKIGLAESSLAYWCVTALPGNKPQDGMDVFCLGSGEGLRNTRLTVKKSMLPTNGIYIDFGSVGNESDHTVVKFTHTSACVSVAERVLKTEVFAQLTDNDGTGIVSSSQNENGTRRSPVQMLPVMADTLEVPPVGHYEIQAVLLFEPDAYVYADAAGARAPYGGLVLLNPVSH